MFSYMEWQPCSSMIVTRIILTHQMLPGTDTAPDAEKSKFRSALRNENISLPFIPQIKFRTKRARINTTCDILDALPSSPAHGVFF